MTGVTEGPDIPALPGYVPIKEAAQMIGLTEKRVYQYVQNGRLHAVRLGNMLALPLEEVQQFRPAPSGRTRLKAPRWRSYKSRGKLVATEIEVRIRPEVREKLLAKFQAVQPEEHTFSRNVARYILGCAESETIRIMLIWKDTEMPDDTTKQEDILRFQHDFPELEWETAHYCSYDIYQHT